MLIEKIGINDIHGKTLAFFGLGRMYARLLPYLPSSITDHVEYLIDNSPDKCGKYTVLAGKKFKVLSLTEYLSQVYNPETHLILLTPTRSKSLSEQLENLHDKNIHWALLNAVLATPEPYNLSKYLTKGEQKIPKRIHYCWFGGNPMSDKMLSFLDSWSKYCPDYEIVRWDESNFDVRAHKFTSICYDLGIWSHVSDYFRIYVLYKYGGIYLDTDIELIRNFDDLLFDDAFAGFGNYIDVNHGLGMGSIRDMPIFEEMLSDFNRTDVIEGAQTKNPIYGPRLITECLQRHGLKCNNSLQTIDGIRIYPTDVLSPSFHWEPEHLINLTKNSYAIHHGFGSWSEWVTDIYSEFHAEFTDN
jgi:mannosyltransferase OCH1-like enzyme